MPLFEYDCKQCGKQFEFLIRNSSDEPVCECGSHDLKRVISSFAVTEGAPQVSGGCSDGTCGLPSSPCASGMCGM